MDQIYRMVDIKNKVNLTKIQGFKTGDFPQMRPSKIRSF